MLAGSPYYELIAINGEPLSAAERAKEEAKFRQESAKRRRESKEARDDRIAKYRDERQHEHLLMNEMARAFNFRLEGEAMIDGHKAYVLQATPKPGYRPINEKARVLTGMKGTLWIDSAQYHWVKVEAEVIHPVNFGLFIAKVRMGTRFELEQAPVRNECLGTQAFCAGREGKDSRDQIVRHSRRGNLHTVSAHDGSDLASLSSC